MTLLRGTFQHVAELGSLDQMGAAIARPDINLAYAMLPISEDGQDYVDALKLGRDGDFADIELNPQQSDISAYRCIVSIDAKTPADITPGKIFSQLEDFPNLPGKGGFAVAVSAAMKTYWDAQNGARPILATIMEKEPCADPFLHLDGMEDGRDMRGLVTFRGGCATRFMDNAQAQIFVGGLWGYKTMLGQVEEIAKTQEIRSVPLGALSIHKGLMMKTVPAFIIQPDGKIDHTETRCDPLAFQNPLGHAEPSVIDCKGQSRLQLMIDQIPNPPSFT